MNEQEAQQAQTIAEITKRLENDEAWMSQSAQSGRDCTIEDRQALLRIVDSQAQKIKSLESELRASKSALEVAAELLPKLRKERDKQEQKIAEQAKEIERLQYKSKALELRCQHGV